MTFFGIVYLVPLVGNPRLMKKAWPKFFSLRFAVPQKMLWRPQRYIDSFYATILFLYPLKTSDILFSDVLWNYRKTRFLKNHRRGEARDLLVKMEAVHIAGVVYRRRGKHYFSLVIFGFFSKSFIYNAYFSFKSYWYLRFNQIKEVLLKKHATLFCSLLNMKK